MKDYDRQQQMDARLTELERIQSQAVSKQSRLSSANGEEARALSLQWSDLKNQAEQTRRMIANDQKVMNEVLNIRAPIDGTIVTWNPQQRLKGLVVEPNQSLVTISDLNGQWQLEVDIPGNKVGYVEKALEVARKDDNKDDDTILAEFAMSTNPSKTFQGRLHRISIRPHTDEGGIQKYRGIITVDPDDELQHGSGATVKIHCGKVPLYKACFHQIIDWYQANVYWF